MPSTSGPEESRHLTVLQPSPGEPDPEGRAGGFRHDASLHRGRRRLLAAAVDFVRSGLEVGELVMVCAPDDVLARLSRESTAAGSQPTLVDLGRYPSRTIAQWITFADRCHATGHPARLLVSPAFGHRPLEVRRQEQFADALINLAVRSDTNLWVRCAFDSEHLDADRTEEVEACHPSVENDGASEWSPGYAGPAHVRHLFAERLVDPAGPARTLVVSRHADLAVARAAIRQETLRAKLPTEEAEAVVLAVHEAALNALSHGGGTCYLSVWRTAARLVCEVRSGHRLRDPMAGHRLASLDDDHGRGLWLANQLCDLVEIRSGRWGTSVRISTWISAKRRLRLA